MVLLDISNRERENVRLCPLDTSQMFFLLTQLEKLNIKIFSHWLNYNKSRLFVESPLILISFSTISFFNICFKILLFNI